MKGLLIFLFVAFFFGCSSVSEKKKNATLEDVEGSWSCTLPPNDENNKEKKVTLYLESGVCHFGSFQDNRTTYSLKNGFLIAKDSEGHVYKAKIIEYGKDKLKLEFLSKWRDEFWFSDSINKPKLDFFRMKVRNSLEIKQVVFTRNAGFGPSPTYTFLFSSSKKFLFEGVEEVPNIGFYYGKVDQRFWNVLTRKLRYIDLSRMKGRIGDLVEDANEVKLEVTTTRGKLSCVFSIHKNVPPEYMDLANYIHLNYETFKFIPLDKMEFLKSGGTPQEKMVEKTLNFIPC